MINRASITQWRAQAPWNTNEQVEQDLIICRALVAIFSDEFLASQLAFRGGTALHKLYLTPQSRYCSQFYCRAIPEITAVLDSGNTIIHGHKEIRLNTLYDSLLFLQSRGYIGVTPVYPKRGHCANSGLVSDWFSPKLAFEKLQIVTTTVFSVYTDFISNNFPLLTSELDCYYGTNLVAVELEYIVGSMPSITMCFLKNQLPDNTRHIIFSWKGQSPLLKENGVDEYFKLWELPSLTYQGQSYTLARTQGCNTQKYLFDRYNFLSVFYDILKDQMETYFKSKLST